MDGTVWRLPGYVVGDRLGAGGTGDVWAGRVAATGERVALKRVAVTDPETLRAAQAEAALLQTLDHPHLVRLHGLVTTTDAAVLVLDLADGGSLADLLAHRGRLAVGEVVTALAPIAAALAYAHQHGVIHGDVSPGNIVFTSIGLPMLADLGVARIVGAAVPVRSTPAYVDPAVAAGCAPGPSSDVFMLGAVAVHALTGAPLWRGASTEEVVARAAAGDLTELTDRLAAVPPSVATVVEQALVVDPHLRCTAAEFALDLRHTEAPLPIELRAGRRLEPATSGRADRPGIGAARRPPGAHRAAGRDHGEALSPGRPAFDRPGRLPATPGRSGALTQSVQAPPRPTLPPPPGPVRRQLGRLYASAPPRRALGVGVAALVLAGAISGGALWWVRQPDRPAAPQLAAATAAPSDIGAHATAATASASAATAAPSAHTSSASPSAVLRHLDDLRAQAFARRDPAVLAEVYAPGPLLDQDRALMLRIVPPGCGLVGARTEFRDVRASVTTAGGWSVRATAQLASSALQCVGATGGRAPGTAPTPLRIELTRAAGGYRITRQLSG
jgi:eukaryotic-like serine/threonine-protein kinase